jgi:hypothetical protein
MEMSRTEHNETLRTLISKSLDKPLDADSLDRLADEITLFPIQIEAAPSGLIITVSYNIITHNTDAGHISLPWIMDEFMGLTSAASLSVIAPGMPENKLIGITSQDFAGESTKPPGTRTKSKVVEVKGSPAGNYTIKLSSWTANTRLEIPMPSRVFFNCISYPSIKIEGGGSVLANVEYPYTQKPGKRRSIDESWMFALEG